MTEFVSDIKKIPHKEDDVFRVLSDLSKLELIKDHIPEDKISNLYYDSDTVSFNVSPIGNVKFNIVERQANKTVKFKSENLPFETYLWIQLVPKAENDTRMRITIRTKLNPLMKGMVAKPIKDGMSKVADVIASLPYDTIP